uniref:Helicase ATP-binding domain-containing protein n=1 Tax=viral metagenome TaxID=1070528 RepID=A0A6C0AQR5_9ZZZZ
MSEENESGTTESVTGSDITESGSTADDFVRSIDGVVVASQETEDEGSVHAEAANSIQSIAIDEHMGYKPKHENAKVEAVPEGYLRYTEPPPESQLEAVPAPFAGPAKVKKPRKLLELRPPPIASTAADFEKRQNRVEQLFADTTDPRAELYKPFKAAFRMLLKRDEEDSAFFKVPYDGTPEYPMTSYESKQQEFEEKGHYALDTEVYMPSTRKAFYRFIDKTYAETFNLEAEVENRVPDPDACQKLMAGGRERVEPFLYQKFVKEYIRMSSPYRGMLVYHGLGSGKTCSSIAAAEALYGVANKRIIVMTPKSIQENFIKEISFCGFRHFSLNNHWVPVPLLVKTKMPVTALGAKVKSKKKIEVKPYLIHEIYARSVISLGADYISRIKYAATEDDDPKTNAFVWIPDFNKPPNYNSLTTAEQDQIRGQINESIKNRIEFISYNGVSAATLKQWACEGTHFDNAVIVIDEVHNLGRLMQGSILPYLVEREGAKRTLKVEPITPDRWKPQLCDDPSRNYTRGFLFYRLLVGARNSKIIGLSGTPIINFPEELGILANVLAGYMDCIEFVLPTSDAGKVAAFKSFLDRDPRIDFIRADPGTANTHNFLVSLFNEGYVKVLDETTKEFKGVEHSDEPEAQIGVTQVFDRILAHATSLGLAITRKPTYKSYPRLPYDGDTFRRNFIDLKTLGVQEKNEFVLKKRLSGIVSYYKGSKSDYLPRIRTDEVIMCDLSDFAAAEYIKQRKYEIEHDAQNEVQDQAANLYAAVEAYSKASNPSSYRFRSRACCNFVFPDSIKRPYPSSAAALNEEIQAVAAVDLEEAVEQTDEEAAAEEAAARAVAAEEGAVVADLATAGYTQIGQSGGSGLASGPEETEATEESAVTEAIEESASVGSTGAVEDAIIGATVQVALSDKQKVAQAMAQLNAKRDSFLRLNGPTLDASLITYSRKLYEMLTRMATSEGPVLVYSDWKTVEGLGVLAIALKANGWEEIRYTGKWWGDDPEFTPDSRESILKGPNAGIKRFITFTGGGTAAQRNVTLKLFNGEFDTLPEKTKALLQEGGFDLKKKYLHGEMFSCIGITGAGAEGISLKNVRQIHIMESYWNSVRTEQVKGRAVRICSHMYLPVSERLVDIYTYVSKFSAAMVNLRGKEGGIPRIIENNDGEVVPGSQPKRVEIYTSDQKVFNISQRKERINQQLLMVLKEAAVDCKANQPDNEPLECFSVEPVGTPYMFDPDLERDKQSSQGTAPPKKSQIQEEQTAPQGDVEAVMFAMTYEGKTQNFILGVQDPGNDYVEFFASNDRLRTTPLGRLMIDPESGEYGDPEFYE